MRVIFISVIFIRVRASPVPWRLAVVYAMDECKRGAPLRSLSYG